MEFPRFVYVSPGPYRYPGGGSYGYVVVNSKKEMDEKMASGHFEHPYEAIEDCGIEAYLYGLNDRQQAEMLEHLEKHPPKFKKKPEPEPEVESQDDSPPTREEMEEMATKLGVRFDGRTSDARLAARIENALREGSR